MLEAIRNLLSPEELESLQGLKTVDGAPVTYSTAPEELRPGGLKEPEPQSTEGGKKLLKKGPGGNFYVPDGRLGFEQGELKFMMGSVSGKNLKKYLGEGWKVHVVEDGAVVATFVEKGGEVVRL